MNKNYKILYCLTFLLRSLLVILCFKLYKVTYYNALTIIALLTFIFGIFKLMKNKKYNTSKKDIIFLITYIIFFLIMSLGEYVYNVYALTPFIHYPYYYNIIIIPYILLNIYTILIFNKK